jgi:hypothetical protein
MSFSSIGAASGREQLESDGLYIGKCYKIWIQVNNFN